MKGNAIRVSVALVVLSFLASVTAAPASARPRWSDWSTPVALASINTPGAEGTVGVSKDNLTLFFATNRAGGIGGDDLWVAHRASTDAAWEAPTNLGTAVNSAANEAGASLSRDGHWLFFHSNRPGGTGSADIYASYRAHTHEDFGENGWQPAMPLVSLNTSSGEGIPNYFQDDETGRSFLFFQSVRPGGLGLSDIWMAEQEPDGSFGPASNVTALNSAFSEFGATVSHDGLEIFFMSNRAGGRFDIWTAVRESVTAEWSTPTAVAPVNSEIHEGFPTLSPDGKTLYFGRSTASIATGDIDIYVSTRTKETGKP